MKDDRLISLNAAIDILEHKKDKNAKGDIGGFYNKIIQNDIDALMQLPPVQPSATDTNVATTDTVSRQAALDALIFDVSAGRQNGKTLTLRYAEEVFKRIKALPSAESELENKIRAIGYTGKEGRIYIGGRLFAVRELPQ